MSLTTFPRPRCVAESLTANPGNIWFQRIKHSWDGDRCKFCGETKVAHGRQKSEAPERTAAILTHLQREFAIDAVQFYQLLYKKMDALKDKPGR